MQRSLSCALKACTNAVISREEKKSTCLIFSNCEEGTKLPSTIKTAKILYHGSILHIPVNINLGNLSTKDFWTFSCINASNTGLSSFFFFYLGTYSNIKVFQCFC